MKVTPFISAIIGSLLLQRIIAKAIPESAQTLQSSSNFTNNVVFRPLPDHESWGTIYARTVQLPDGSHLLSWEDYSPEPPLLPFPIYRSEDGGTTWSNFSQVQDQVNGWGNRYQPHFFVLPETFGQYPAGTVIVGGMSVRKDLAEAWLDIYASTDNGKTWTFVSHAVHAPGPETVNNGDKAVWEPFFLVHQGQLVLHFSDQRDERYAQKLAHITTTNLKDWSEPVNDVTYPSYGYRPGMTTVAHIRSTGQWIMTYELCGSPDPGCPSYYKVASSPLAFDTVQGRLLKADTGENPGSAPYVIWTEHPERDDGSGVIILNGAQNQAVYVNEDSAEPDGWRRVNTEQHSAHSRSLEIIVRNGQKKLMLAGGGHMSSGADNFVSVGVIDIPY
ncbi:Sialidase [Boeremia exigua]|uniref:Sialidase n=1 Tax=Boeremia exigua TaxID=749465 RepID=UPI001E8DD091|nr:Sialidase [Boeremia exigua]KAH6625210.1 Sialidase [Boeremia exigua]